MSDPLTSVPVSLVVITRDAGRDLADCLASASFAAEKIVVDSGSRDDTVEIAQRSGARIVRHPWLGFGPQKNFAVAQAAYDWVLCLDADERISPELARAIRDVLAAPRHGAYALARRNRFLGRWLAHGEGYPDWNVRLFDRRCARWTDDPVHEHVVALASGDGLDAQWAGGSDARWTGRSSARRAGRSSARWAGRLDGDLLHASAESIDAYLAKQNRYTTLQAAALHARGERFSALRMCVAPLIRFIRFYVVRGGFLDGVPGLVHIAIGCFNSFSKYAKLRALEQGGRE